MSFVIRPVVKLIGSGIGLGREAYLQHKETKSLSRQHSEDATNNLEAGGQPDQGEVHVHASKEVAEVLISCGEAVATTDEKQAQLSLQRRDSNQSLDSVDEDDEREWILDEAASPPAYDELDAERVRSASVTTLVREVMPDSTASVSHARLPYPVILPQRRPGTHTRGFIRAYAPDLVTCGIDQDTFLRFVKNFHAASQASPALNVVKISAAAVGYFPSVITMAVSISVQIAAGVAIEVQGRYRTNTYLDEINKELFMPKGLYAMVVKYKSEASNSGTTEIGIETADMMTAKAIAKYAPTDAAATKSFKAKFKNIRLVSGSSVGERAMPTMCAPLIFPALDAAIENSTTARRQLYSSHSTSSLPSSSTSPSSSSRSPSTFRSKPKSAGKFIADYWDRRAQAKYISKHPSTTLATTTTKPEFRSRYSDPNHPANSGHIVNLITGGRIRMDTHYADRREMRDERRVARGREPRGKREGGARGGPLGMVMKALKPDVLYLMVVNMPTESELAEARQMLESA